MDSPDTRSTGTCLRQALFPGTAKQLLWQTKQNTQLLGRAMLGLKSTRGEEK